MEISISWASDFFGAGLVSAASSFLSLSLFSPSPSDFLSSKTTVETGWRKKLEPSAQVIVLPSSAHWKSSAPISVSFLTGTEGVFTLTAGVSPPGGGTVTRKSCSFSLAKV